MGGERNRLSSASAVVIWQERMAECILGPEKNRLVVMIIIPQGRGESRSGSMP